MKKAFLFALVAILALGLATAAFAAISGSKHDLGTGGAVADPGDAQTAQTCVFCHHPHVGTATPSAALLWNNDDWAGALVTPYSSNTLNVVTAVPTSAEYQSYLCMGCHDGTITAGALVQAPKDGQDTTINIPLTAGANLGLNFEDDHPVNFAWAGIPAAEIPTNYPAAPPAALPLYTGKVQCATCHDVHNVTNADPNIQFMRMTTAASAICTACHLTK